MPCWTAAGLAWRAGKGRRWRGGGGLRTPTLGAECQAKVLVQWHVPAKWGAGSCPPRAWVLPPCTKPDAMGVLLLGGGGWCIWVLFIFLAQG